MTKNPRTAVATVAILVMLALAIASFWVSVDEENEVNTLTFINLLLVLPFAALMATRWWSARTLAALFAGWLGVTRLAETSPDTAARWAFEILAFLGLAVGLAAAWQAFRTADSPGGG